MLENQEALAQLMTDLSSRDEAVALAAQEVFAETSAAILREAIFPGNLFQDLFKITEWDVNDTPFYVTDLINPTSVNDWKAFASPEVGGIPQNFAQPNKFLVPTLVIKHAGDIPVKSLRLKQYSVMERLVKLISNGMEMKMNDMAWRAIIAAVVANGNIQVDTGAAVGQFSKNLWTSLVTHFVRASGSNNTSSFGFKLTRIYLSPEGHASLVNLTNADLPETVRSKIYEDDGMIRMLGGISFYNFTQLGVGAQYNTLFTDLGGSFTNSKTQLCVGIDGTKKDLLEMPVTRMPEIFEDPTTRRSGKYSLWAEADLNAVVLDNRVVRGGQF